MAAPIVGQVRDLIDEGLARLYEGPGRDLVLAVRTKLHEPLRVTVAGSVSSGKSTLVNALLGQKVAPVDAGECTRVVTEFRYGAQERAEVVTADGERHRLVLERGRVPSSLGVPLESVRHVEVHLSNAVLRSMTLVDTPGLNTVSTDNEERTVSFLGVDAGTAEDPAVADTSVAIGQADALVFLMPHLRAGDAKVLESFRSLYDGTGLSAINAVGVLSKADKLSRTGVPLEVAAPIAERMRRELQGLVSAVVPVIGLLAETSATAVLTESDARALAALATIDDPLDREDLLLSPEDFLDFPLDDVAEGPRRRLLGLLDLYGLQVALGVLDGGRRGVGPVLRALDEASGLAPLRSLLLDRFAAQADLLKAHVALCDLQRISYLRDDPANADVLRSLRDPLERIELDPAMHQLRLLEVVHAANRGDLRLSDEQAAEVERLATGRDPRARLGAGAEDDPAAAAAGRAAAWSSWGQDPRRSPAEARLAREVKGAYEVLWSELARAEDPA